MVADCEALLAARDALAGEGELNWSVSIPLTTWEGVRVGGFPRRVVLLRVSNRGLNGVIPPGLGMLTGLEYLSLSGNRLTGAIPPELGNLSNLRVLYLSWNSLSGGIPAELGRLMNLEILDLGRNQLTGGIPRDIGGLSNLQMLYLAVNFLTGEVPVEFTRLGNLQTFHIQHNRLSGCVSEGLRYPDTEIGTMRFCGDLLPIWPDRPTFEGGVDLGVTHIERLPRFQRYSIAYFGRGDCTYPLERFEGAVVCPHQSGIKRWPDPGETVELTAHVWNFGDTASGPFDFEWKKDDRSFMKGLHEGLGSGERTEFVLTMEWPDDAANPMLTFAVDTQDQIGELIEDNNAVVDWVKGYTLGIFFSPEAYESLRLSSRQGRLIESPEQWVHNNIVHLNGLLAHAGLEDRVRAELFYITDEQNLRYRHDLQWYMDGWWDIWHNKHTYFNEKNYANRPYVDWGLLHELMHQLGVIDIYRMHLKTNQVMVPDANRLGEMAGCGQGYWHDQKVCFRFSKDIRDLMSTGQPIIGPHTAGGLRSNTGYRRGFYRRISLRYT